MRSCTRLSAAAGSIDFFIVPREAACTGTYAYLEWVPIGTLDQLCTEAAMSVQTSRSAGSEIHAGRPTPKGAWLIIGLLFLFMLINFADKAVIGIAAVP